MKQYQYMICGKFPQTGRIQANTLQEALSLAKKQVNADDWDICPIRAGEKWVDTYFKFDGKRYGFKVWLL